MKKISKLIAFVLVLVLGVILVACGNKGGGDNTAVTVNELTAESGVSASGTFEGGSKLKAEAHTADSEKGRAAISAIDKPYDNARVAVFDITLTKGGEKVQPSGKVKITMPKPFEADEYVTYHVKGDVVEELETAVVGDKISFETTSFSYFVITTNKVMHRTKLNYKGVWAPSATGEPVDITEYFKDPLMIDKEGDAYKMADVVEEDTALKLCANPDNYKYEARARDKIGYLFARGTEDWEFCAEIRAGSPTGPAIAKWHGYEIYSYYRHEKYDDYEDFKWTESHFLQFIGEVHPKLEYVKFASVKNVDGYTDENGGWISKEDALDVYVVRTPIGTSQRLNRRLSADKYGVLKISERAFNTRQSSIAGYPRYWWSFDIEKGKPTHWLLINGNVQATVFNGRGEFVQSGYDMKLKFDYDESLDTGSSESKFNTYFILLEENGVENPDCKMDLQFLQTP